MDASDLELERALMEEMERQELEEDDKILRNLLDDITESKSNIGCHSSLASSLQTSTDDNQLQAHDTTEVVSDPLSAEDNAAFDDLFEDAFANSDAEETNTEESSSLDNLFEEEKLNDMSSANTTPTPQPRPTLTLPTLTLPTLTLPTYSCPVPSKEPVNRDLADTTVNKQSVEPVATTLPQSKKRSVPHESQDEEPTISTNKRLKTRSPPLQPLVEPTMVNLVPVNVSHSHINNQQSTHTSQEIIQQQPVTFSQQDNLAMIQDLITRHEAALASLYAEQAELHIQMQHQTQMLQQTVQQRTPHTVAPHELPQPVRVPGQQSLRQTLGQPAQRSVPRPRSAVQQQATPRQNTAVNTTPAQSQPVRQAPAGSHAFDLTGNYGNVPDHVSASAQPSSKRGRRS